MLGAGDNGSQVELSSGQVLEVTLASNPTTGYSWEVSEVDEAVLAQLGEAEFQQAPTEGEQMVGVGGTETFRFASATGETTLTLVYHRPWEKGRGAAGDLYGPGSGALERAVGAQHPPEQNRSCHCEKRALVASDEAVPSYDEWALSGSCALPLQPRCAAPPETFTA